jgi:rubredoxin
MLTPGTLGLLEAMADGQLADLEPRVGNRGAITYPDAEAYLPDDERASPVLESLADQGILEREFREKVHRCPECEPTELRYETVCPECGSPETRRETILEHATCGYAAPRERFDAEGRCPDCGDSFVGITGEYATVGERHQCTSCAWRFSELEGRLRCRRCSQVLRPSRAPEAVCYRYRFAGSRRDWLYTQLAARGAVRDVLSRRGFETAREETVIGASGIEYLLDLYGVAEERGLAVLAAVAEDPTAEDVIDIHATSIDVDAYPILIATGESPDDPVAGLADHLDVGLLQPTEPREPALSCEAAPWPESPR